MIKSILLTICLVLNCWSQLAVAQSNCPLAQTFSQATSTTFRDIRFAAACYRLKFESGTLTIVNYLPQCFNTQINVYDLNNNKVGDLCSSNTFSQTGSGFYVDLSFGQVASYAYILVNFSPSSSNSNNGNSNNGNSNSNTGTCGLPAIEPTISKIVGGTAAKAHSWPWQVYLSIKKANSYYMCGGSLIDNNYVLTAAHCINGVKAATDVTVYAGIHYASETYSQKGILASKVIQHESYSTSTLQNDIALIKLNSNVTFNSTINKICLPSSNLTATSGIMTGWGAVNVAGTKTADELMQVKVPIYPTNTKCGTASVTGSQFCAGTASSNTNDVKDSCFGDSGGPVVTRASSTAPFVIDGIVSYGETNVCNGNGIYTRVYSFVSWINNKKSTN